jgi:hypothetical protein
MSFYIFLSIFVIIGSFCYSKCNNINVAVASKSFVFLLLFVPAAIRYGPGTDYFSYIRGFRQIAIGYNVNIKGGELGFYYLQKFIQYLNLDVQWLFVVMAFFTYLFLFKAVPRKSFFLIIPLYLFFCYTASYNILRQAITVTIAYYAYQLFIRKKIIKSFFYLFVAVLFQRISLLYFIIFFISSFININKKGSILLFILIMISFQFRYTILDIIVNTIIPYTPFQNYTLSNPHIRETESNSGLGFLLRYFIFTSVLLFSPKNGDKIVNKAFIWFLLLIFTDVLASTIWIFYRLRVAFDFSWFLMLHFINTQRTKFRKILLLAIFSYGFLMFVYSLTIEGVSRFNRHGADSVVPYVSIFEKYKEFY